MHLHANTEYKHKHLYIYTHTAYNTLQCITCTYNSRLHFLFFIGIYAVHPLFYKETSMKCVAEIK